MDGVVSMTVVQALTLMIARSDNYVAYLHSDKVQLSSVESFLKANGITNSYFDLSGGLPTITALDIALFNKKLYFGQLGNNQITNNMFNLLKQQQRNEKIP